MGARLHETVPDDYFPSLHDESTKSASTQGQQSSLRTDAEVSATLSLYSNFFTCVRETRAVTASWRAYYDLRSTVLEQHSSEGFLLLDIWRSAQHAAWSTVLLLIVSPLQSVYWTWTGSGAERVAPTPPLVHLMHCAGQLTRDCLLAAMDACGPSQPISPDSLVGALEQSAELTHQAELLMTGTCVFLLLSWLLLRYRYRKYTMITENLERMKDEVDRWG